VTDVVFEPYLTLLYIALIVAALAEALPPGD
jgi:hypothetical protein